MSHPEAPQPEAQVETHVEPVHEESPGLTQREFLKKLVGSAAGITGLAAAGTLLTPKAAEAAYAPGGSPYPGYLPGDQITTNVHVAGSAAIRGPRPWLDVTAFGASGDWSTSANAAVNAALASTPGPCILYFPPGIYVFDGPVPVTIHNRSVTLMGAGRHVTYFFFYPGAGFNITMSDHVRITIRDIQFQAGNGHNPHPAIRIESKYWIGSPLLAPHIHDVLIDVADGSSSWAKGIELKGVTGARIHDFQIICGSIANSTHGIHLLEGGDPIHGSTIASITDGFISNTQVGIQASYPQTEGLYLRAIEVLGGNVGYLLDAPGPGTAISDCHAATREAGIKIVDHGDMALVGNLLYGEAVGYVGIDCHGTGTPSPVYGAHNMRIIGNQINFAGNGTGIRLSGYASGGVIQGNVVNNTSANPANGIVLGEPTLPTNVVTSNVVTGNRLNVPVPTQITGTSVGSNWTTPNY